MATITLDPDGTTAVGVGNPSDNRLTADQGLRLNAYSAEPG